MSQNPNPFQQQLPRAAIVGIVLAVAAVILFVVIYLALSDQQPPIRLFVSLCVPPGILAIAVGAFILIRSGRENR